MADKFHRAARDGYLDILREANRKEINTTDEDGCTPAMLAAQHGNLDALRQIIMRGGNVNKQDLLGNTPLHHSARHGQINCVTFLVNFGANFWALDNDYHTALEVAAQENREDIVRFLDDAQSMQTQKNPKMVQQFKENAAKEADKNIKNYERVQVKASKEMEKSRRKLEKDENDFTAPSDASVFKKITIRFKGGGTNKLKSKNGANGAFSNLVNGTAKSGVAKKLSTSNNSSTSEFRTSEMDDQGNRTMKSVKGTVSRSGGQVLYLTNKEIPIDNSARPALSKVFPGTSLDDKKWNRKNDQNNDSGIDSFESVHADEEETSGIFNRPNFGNISFLNRIDHMTSYKMNGDAANGELEGLKGSDEPDGSNRDSAISLENGKEDLPWHDDDVNLDDDDDDSEYTPVVMFLEMCGLTHYTHLFTSGDVDMAALMMMTTSDFQDMGIPIGPRRKLMDAIQRRRVILNEPAQMYDSPL